MKLIIVESARKSKQLNAILKELSVDDEYRSCFCAGRLFDWKVGKSNSYWEPVNTDILKFVTSQINKSESVIAMTDNDEQGEFIAFQIASLAQSKQVLKGDLLDLSKNGLSLSLRTLRDIDISKVSQAMFERQLNIRIAEHSIEKGYPPLSLQKMAVCAFVNSGAELYQKHTMESINGKSFSFTFLDTKKSDSDLSLIPPQGPSTFDVMLDCALTGKSELRTVHDRLSSLYDSGCVSYSRTPSNEWHSSSEQSVDSLLDIFGSSVDDSNFRNHINDDSAHSALYLLDPSYLHLGYEEINSIVNRTTNSLIDNKGFNVRIGGSKLNYLNVDLLGRDINGLSKASPEQVVFHALSERISIKPSTIGQLTTNISKELWQDNRLLNQQRHQLVLDYTHKYSPGVLELEFIELNGYVKDTNFDNVIERTKNSSLDFHQSISLGL